MSTAHRAKGLEWDSVQVAGDFREIKTANTASRAESMLAYVAVTRARTGLDRTGLAWIDNYGSRSPAVRASVAGTIRKENTMNSSAFDVGFGDATHSTALLDDSPHAMARPYAGGRAQAESGSRIIENDYNRWRAISRDPYGLPEDHPHVQQLSRAWSAVSKAGLGDDPGAASIRYQVLAHAAGVLAETASNTDLSSETKALQTLRQHALAHGYRLQATGLDLFLRSSKAGPYAGRGHAVSGSRIIEKDYRRWIRTSAANRAANDGALRESAAAVKRAWSNIELRGLNDGPEPAAARYRTLAGYARNLADDIGYRLPSAGLAPLLELAMHADKHAIRLHATALARTGGSAADVEALCQATWERPVAASSADRPAPYHGLPAQVAATAARGHSENPHVGQASAPAENGIAHPARTRAAQNERADLATRPGRDDRPAINHLPDLCAPVWLEQAERSANTRLAPAVRRRLTTSGSPESSMSTSASSSA